LAASGAGAAAGAAAGAGAFGSTFQLRHRRQALGHGARGHCLLVLHRARAVEAHRELRHEHDAHHQRHRSDGDPDRELHGMRFDVVFDGVVVVLAGHVFPREARASAVRAERGL
jgi:hypothetical protein